MASSPILLNEERARKVLPKTGENRRGGVHSSGQCAICTSGIFVFFPVIFYIDAAFLKTTENRFFRRISMTLSEIEQFLGPDAKTLLEHRCKGIPKESLHLPGPDFVDRIFLPSDRKPAVLRNIQQIIGTGRLKGTGYLSILPVDQGIEHSAGASFAPNPAYFDPENIVRLAIEGGCNAVASTFGVLGSVARKYAHKIPFIVKINHNEFLSYPNTYDQIMFGDIDMAFELGAVAVGATIYFGSEESKRQIQEVSAAFKYAHELGLATILWCYTRNAAFKTKEKDYHLSADLTGQANHLGVTIEADIIKQKLPENNGGYTALNFGKTHKKVYTELTSDNPIDLTRYQVANCYMGRIGLINSGGASGANDLAEAVKTAVINKRAGGMGLITGRKAFQKPMADGARLLNTIQDVYLTKEVTIA
jgi:class I fructose-bisphosphate aldolase